MTKTIGFVTALALALSTAPAALACFGYCGGGYGGNSNSSSFTTTTNVAVSNSASVSNSVSVSASTGGNDANGGSASGKNANGGTGGTIDTGNAAASSLVANEVNSVDMEVVAPENCGCAEVEGSSHGRHGKKGNKKTVETELNVALDNNASISNSVEVKAKTGYNNANGGSAEASQSENNYRHGKWGGKRGSSTATAGHGGLITTGDAESSSGIVNLINSVVLRVL